MHTFASANQFRHADLSKYPHNRRGLGRVPMRYACRGSRRGCHEVTEGYELHAASPSDRQTRNTQ